MAEDDELVPIASFSEIPEAHLARAAIEAAGIPCYLADEYTVGMNWFYSSAIGGVKLLVRNADVAAARDVLKSVRHPPASDEAAGSDRRRDRTAHRFASLASIGVRALRAARVLLKWLFNPAPFVAAVRGRYRREFQLAAALFGVGLLAGVLLTPYLKDRAPSLPVATNVDEAIQRGADNKRADDDPSRRYWDAFLKALDKNDTAEANRILPQIVITTGLDDFMAPRPPRLSELLESLWILVFVLWLGDSLLLVALGFFFGLYPAGRTVVNGLSWGLLLSHIFHARLTVSPILEAWFFPACLVYVLVSLLPAAVGLDMGRYIFQRHKGTWFVDHLRTALKTWGKAVAPALLLTMAYLAAAFATIVIVSGNPVVP